MDAARFKPGSAGSTPSIQRQHQRRSSQSLVQGSTSHSENSSETNSDSGRNMHRGNSDYQRGRGGHGGGRGDNRTSSHSSGGSTSITSNRPTLRPSSAPEGNVTSPEQSTRTIALINSPLSPDRRQSSFTLNGHQINETYTARPGTLSSPSQHLVPRSPGRGNSSHRNRTGGQPPANIPLRRDGRKHWAYQQEQKFRFLRIPKTCWTKDLYLALAPYGTVVRIEMQPSALDSNAYVTFQ